MLAAERRERIAKIRNLPKQLQEAVKGLNEEQLLTPYREGGWTPAQVVHHLADSHVNAYARLRLALTEDNPPVKAYDQALWAELPDAKSPVLAPSFAILRGLHRRWSNLLKSVGRKDWQRTYIHPDKGPVTLEDYLVTYSNHGEKHIGHIMGLRQARGW
jgi:DinB family protein